MHSKQLECIWHPPPPPHHHTPPPFRVMHRQNTFTLPEEGTCFLCRAVATNAFHAFALIFRKILNIYGGWFYSTCLWPFNPPYRTFVYPIPPLLRVLSYCSSILSFCHQRDCKKKRASAHCPSRIRSLGSIKTDQVVSTCGGSPACCWGSPGRLPPSARGPCRGWGSPPPPLGWPPAPAARAARGASHFPARTAGHSPPHSLQNTVHY